ncbi:hypothetical protein ALC56_07612 [Trachymyrmex septentrionalis]|uniref:Uncharacterized protein n=1 Tax=Trachymyrmex septentrionalis TaxID=34720 RepID=A0A195FC50_9HYME|nr:hypothetical protein ALC56_07612 [Trachymyrmex septentrionalis]
MFRSPRYCAWTSDKRPRGGPDECVNYIHVLHRENACAHCRQQVGVSTDRIPERNGCSTEVA